MMPSGGVSMMPNEPWAKQLLFKHVFPGGPGTVGRGAGRPHAAWAEAVHEVGPY